MTRFQPPGLIKIGEGLGLGFDWVVFCIIEGWVGLFFFIVRIYVMFSFFLLA